MNTHGGSKPANEDHLPSLGEEDLTTLISVPEEVVPLTHGWRSPTETIALDPTDEAPLVMGDDGDDAGKLTKAKFRIDGNGDPERMLAQLAPQDMLDSGHGFMVRTQTVQPRTEWRTTCEVCGDPILAAAGEWLCELGRLASTLCNCNWCLHYQMWLRGEYRPRGGRPAQRCGTAECKRKAARERQRKSRAARKAQGVTETL